MAKVKTMIDSEKEKKRSRLKNLHQSSSNCIKILALKKLQTKQNH